MTGVIGRVVQSRGIRQLIKFCIVGVSSLTIDLIVFNLLLEHVAPIWALSAAFVAGVSNSFFWNSRWTFAGNERNLKRQLPIFFGTNMVGFLLNTIITTGCLVGAAHLHLMQTNHPPDGNPAPCVFPIRERGTVHPVLAKCGEIMRRRGGGRLELHRLEVYNLSECRSGTVRPQCRRSEWNE